jgi:hypothetical protein
LRKLKLQQAIAHAIIELADKRLLEDVSELLTLAFALETDGDDFLAVLVKVADERGITADYIKDNWTGVQVFEPPPWMH